MLDRKIKPSPTGDIIFSLPKIEKFELSNGLKVLFVKKNNLPIVQFNLLIDAGSSKDSKENSGLANLTAMCIDEGAGEYNALELDNEIESIGSILGISANQDSTFITMLSLTEKFERSVELFSDILIRPHFNEEDFERQQHKALTHLLQMNDQPSYIATSIHEQIIFKDSIYELPIYGNDESIKNIENKNVLEFYKKYYSVSNSHLIVVGDVELEYLKIILEKHLHQWQNSSSNFNSELNIQDSEAQIYFIEKEEAAQSEIRIGHLCGNKNAEDFYSNSIMNSLLGGQFSSRINLNLREDKGFTYGAQSAFHYNSVNGYFAVSTAVESKNTGEALSEIFKELKLVKNTITKEEVEFSKSNLVKRYPSMFETYSQIARNLTSQIIYNLSENYFDTYIEKIEDTTFDEIVYSANNKIKLDNLITLVVGNKSVKAQLKEFSDSTIIDLDIYGNLLA
ncbi:MAG: insulinase family protein [Melioribacteraceae bacterium]|nr:insulinase family protein [Melioribacteraceae bacterium]